MILDGVKAAATMTLATIVQVAFVNGFELAEGRTDVAVVVLVCIALLRGPLFGAVCGFWAGLIVDVATLGTLGLTSLLLTVAGYWAGRLGELTSQHGNQRSRILLAVTLITVGVQIGSLVVHLLLGDSASVGALLGRVLLPTLLLNVAVGFPLYWLFRKVLPPPPSRRERMQEVVIV